MVRLKHKGEQHRQHSITLHQTCVTEDGHVSISKLPKPIRYRPENLEKKPGIAMLGTTTIVDAEKNDAGTPLVL